MPINQDFQISRGEDLIIEISLTPPQPIGGYGIRFQSTRRFGGNYPLITKSMASGFYNVSGMNILNSGNGSMNVVLKGPDTSGLDFGNYSYTVARTDSGFYSEYLVGYVVLRA